MATYSELRTLFNDSALRNRITVAVAIAAQGIIANAGTETATRIAWAQRALQAPEAASATAMIYALAENNGLSVAQITGATDAALQSVVDGAVDGLAVGMVSGG